MVEWQEAVSKCSDDPFERGVYDFNRGLLADQCPIREPEARYLWLDGWCHANNRDAQQRFAFSALVIGMLWAILSLVVLLFVMYYFGDKN